MNLESPSDQKAQDMEHATPITVADIDEEEPDVIHNPSIPTRLYQPAISTFFTATEKKPNIGTAQMEELVDDLVGSSEPKTLNVGYGATQPKPFVMTHGGDFKPTMGVALQQELRRVRLGVAAVVGLSDLLTATNLERAARQ